MLNSLSNVLHRLSAAMAERRDLRRAYAELSALDDRSLADIGISRSEIPYVLTHSRKQALPSAPQAPVGGKFRHAA